MAVWWSMQMNERIRELIEQAGFYVYSWNEDEVEALARLIVIETMQVVANQLPRHQYLNVADAVIAHFKGTK